MVALSSAAQELGAHAVLVFWSLLATVLALISVSWLAWSHTGCKVWWAALPSAWQWRLRILVGFALLACVGAFFTEMTEALDVKDEMGAFDVTLADALRMQLSPNVLRSFAALTRLGGVSTLTVLCAIVAIWLLWQRHRVLAFAWMLAIAGNGGINGLLKEPEAWMVRA